MSITQRVAGRYLRARVSPDIAGALLGAREKLPAAIQHEIDSFLHGVFGGQMQRLEKHHRILWEAFTEARRVLASKYGPTVKMYRGEPIAPPKIKRNFLSWTTDPRMAAMFAHTEENHVISAEVALRDIVFGMTSPHNDMYIEYLVRDRPKYHLEGSKVPVFGWVDLFDLGEEQAAVQAIKDAGGKVLVIRRPGDEKDPYNERDYITIGAVLPPEANIAPFTLENPRPDPKYFGLLSG